jgi:hypothetical protein
MVAIGRLGLNPFLYAIEDRGSRHSRQQVGQGVEPELKTLSGMGSPTRRPSVDQVHSSIEA